jgi:hypothetical protein
MRWRLERVPGGEPVSEVSEVSDPEIPFTHCPTVISVTKTRDLRLRTSSLLQHRERTHERTMRIDRFGPRADILSKPHPMDAQRRQSRATTRLL